VKVVWREEQPAVVIAVDEVSIEPAPSDDVAHTVAPPV
jgi:hypothetical protein